jgi:hypothetical protein
MNDPDEGLSHAANLREEFDRGFTEPTRERAAAVDDFLKLRVQGNPFAFRLAELSSLQTNLPLASARSTFPDFLGIVGLRGTLVPVYDLHLLLGRSPAQEPRWLAITNGKDPVALAFEDFEGHVRGEAGSGLMELQAGESATPQGLELPAGLYLVISVTSIIDVIQQRIRRSGPSKE